VVMEKGINRGTILDEVRFPRFIAGHLS
jgi:hypothetical protein